MTFNARAMLCALSGSMESKSEPGKREPCFFKKNLSVHVVGRDSCSAISK